jgi:DNA-binding ferritin-like protein (Dps family)
MDFDMMVEMYNIAKFYIPQDDHYDLAKDVVRYLTDMGHTEEEIIRAFREFPEVIDAVDDYAMYTQETEDVMDMDVEEYVAMEKREYEDEKFGGDYYEYLDEE